MIAQSRAGNGLFHGYVKESVFQHTNLLIPRPTLAMDTLERPVFDHRSDDPIVLKGEAQGPNLAAAVCFAGLGLEPCSPLSIADRRRSYELSEANA